MTALRAHAGKIAVSLGLTAVLLYFFLSKIDFVQTKKNLLAASAGWLALSFALGVMTFAFRAIRWTWILRPIAIVRFSPAFRATAAGFAANNLPGKVGEVLRPALLARSEKLPFSPLLASVALERVFDGATVILFLLVAIWAKPSESLSLGLIGLVPAAVLAALVALTLFAVFRRAQTERFLEFFWRRLPARLQPAVGGFAKTFVDGFASIKSPLLLLLIGAGSIGMWFVINLQIYCTMRAVGVDLPLPASYVVTAAAVLGLAVPTPGGLGSYQAAVQQALTTIFAVNANSAGAVAILAWLSSFVLITLIGLGILAFSGRQRALARSAEKLIETTEHGTADAGRATELESGRK